MTFQLGVIGCKQFCVAVWLYRLVVGVVPVLESGHLCGSQANDVDGSWLALPPRHRGGNRGRCRRIGVRCP